MIDDEVVAPHLPAPVNELLTTQDNVVALWQVDPGVRRAIRRAHQLGQWHKITDEVFAAAPAEPTHRQTIWAASLHAGSNGLLGGQAALYGSGWEHDIATPFDLLVPRTSRRTGPDWIRVRRTTRVMKRPKTGMQRCRPVPACLDAAAWARTDREAVFVVMTCLSGKLVTPAELRKEMKDRPTMNRRALVEETITDVSDGAMSMGELDFTRLCKEYKIRPPDRQVKRVTPSGQRVLDAYWDAERIVVEIDGVGHANVETMRDDHERQNWEMINGDRIFLRVFAWVLKYEPEVFMTQLAVVVGQRASR